MIDYKVFCTRLIWLIAVIGIVFGFIALGFYLLPFLLAIIVAMGIEPLVRYFQDKFPKLSKKIIVGFWVFIVYGILGALITLICFKFLKESALLINLIPDMYEKAKTMFDNNFESFKNMYHMLPSGVSDKIYDIGTSILTEGTKFITNIFNSIFNFVLFLPTIIIYAIVTILATFFIAVDRHVIMDKLREILPKVWYANFTNIVQKSITSLFKYVKSQFILAGITFIGSVIAFIVIAEPYPFTISLVLALLDILPVLGIGVVMIPWAIYYGVVGNMSKAITIIVIYAILLIIRQLLEPKVVSSSLGIKPIITLLSMFVGFKVFGVFGMIFGPILCIILKDVFGIVLESEYVKKMFVLKKGIFKRYKKINTE